MNDWICYTKAMNFSFTYMKDTHFQCILQMLEEKNALSMPSIFKLQKFKIILKVEYFETLVLLLPSSDNKSCPFI